MNVAPASLAKPHARTRPDKRHATRFIFISASPSLDLAEPTDWTGRLRQAPERRDFDMPTPEQIVEFRTQHHEPLVPVPPEHAKAFKAGKIAVLMPPPEITEGKDIIIEAIGIVDRDRGDEALYLLRLRVVDLPAVHKREVFYYSEDIWPPVEERHLNL
jgi:hypothetical protein